MSEAQKSGLRQFSILMLAMLGVALLMVGIVGVSGIVPILVKLGVLNEPIRDYAAIRSIMIISVSGGLLLLIVGSVLTFARDVARKGVWLFLSGLALLLVGSGPLVAVDVAARLGFTVDPNPNPVLFGVLAFLTFGPAVLLVFSGAILFAVGKFRRS